MSPRDEGLVVTPGEEDHGVLGWLVCILGLLVVGAVVRWRDR